MKIFKILGFCLLAGAVLDTVGCVSASSYTKKGPEAPAPNDTVKITNCTADPDTVLISKGHTLTWTVNPPEPGHTYLIKFPGRKPIASSVVPPDQGQTVTGDSVCTLLGWVSSSKYCVYGYDIIKDGATCKDPGVHVGAGGPGGYGAH